MHDIEAGHKCPLCKAVSICLIEDGFCENEGHCDTCRREEYQRLMYRQEGDYERW